MGQEERRLGRKEEKEGVEGRDRRKERRKGRKQRRREGKEGRKKGRKEGRDLWMPCVAAIRWEIMRRTTVCPFPSVRRKCQNRDR